VDYERALGSPPAAPPPQGRPAQPAAPPPSNIPITWPIAAGGAAVLVVALAMGVLIGNTTSGGSGSSPQVITVGGGAAGGTGGAATPAAGFKEDWPSGKSGWTVQLQALPKSGNGASQVAAAKQAATSKGAKGVGALDSDQHASLKGGFYVVYAGVFDSKKQAQKALAGLKKQFPNARVVQVGDSGSGKDAKSLSGKKSATVDKSQLQQLNNLSPDQYQKQSKKLPSTLKLPGKPPPVDKSKPVGGGSPTETIK
jgi:hypothetical protein